MMRSGAAEAREGLGLARREAEPAFSSFETRRALDKVRRVAYKIKNALLLTLLAELWAQR